MSVQSLLLSLNSFCSCMSSTLVCMHSVGMYASYRDGSLRNRDVSPYPAHEIRHHLAKDLILLHAHETLHNPLWIKQGINLGPSKNISKSMIHRTDQ